MNNFETPDIFDYIDYRMFIHDCLKINGLTYRKFGKELDINSMSYIYGIVNKSGFNKKISCNSINKICRLFRLTGKTEIYFRCMILVKNSTIIEEHDKIGLIRGLSAITKYGVTLITKEQ